MTKKVFDKKLLWAGWSCKNEDYGFNQIYYSSLRRIFKNLILFDPQEVIYRECKEVMNKKFLDLVKKEDPDFIFMYIVYEEFDLDTIAAIKKINPKIKIINFCGEENDVFDNLSIHRFPFIDYFFIIQEHYINLYKKYHKKAFFVFGADPIKSKPQNVTKKIYDTTFICTPKVDRIDYINFLLKNGIDIKI